MTTNRLIETYNKLLTIVHEAAKKGDKITQGFWESLETNLIKIEHFSIDDAADIIQSLQRDLSEARQVIKEAGHAIEHWIEWDETILKNELKQWVEIVADEQSIDWMFLQKQWDLNREYSSGDLVGIGKVHCKNCGQLQYFSEPTVLSACPHCQSTDFQRDPMH